MDFFNAGTKKVAVVERWQLAEVRLVVICNSILNLNPTQFPFLFGIWPKAGNIRQVPFFVPNSTKFIQSHCTH